MKKKLIGFILLLILLFSLTACSQRLAEYKETAKEQIESYANAKGEDNYSTDEWAEIQKIVADGKIEIDAAEDRNCVDTFTNNLKTAIDAIKEDKMEKITVGDLCLTVTVNKTNAQKDDIITVVMELENYGENNVLVEVPDWIAANGGSKLEDTLICYFLPYNSGFKWTANSISVKPRPRATFNKESVIKKVFEYTVLESGDLEIFAAASFYTGDASSSYFNNHISMKINPIKINIEN